MGEGRVAHCPPPDGGGALTTEAVLQRHQSPAGDPGGTFSLVPLRCCAAAAIVSLMNQYFHVGIFQCQYISDWFFHISLSFLLKKKIPAPPQSRHNALNWSHTGHVQWNYTM